MQKGESEAERAEQNVFFLCLVCLFFSPCLADWGKGALLEPSMSVQDGIWSLEKPTTAGMAFRAACSGTSNTRWHTHTHTEKGVPRFDSQ